MFNFLKKKESLLQQKTNKLLQQQRTISNTTIKSVGILTTENLADKFNLEKLVEKNLEINKAKIFSYKKLKQKQELPYYVFSNFSISKKGEIIDSNFKEFLQTKYDLLICFFDNKNVYLEYASAVSKASYKVGFSGVNSSLLNLEIKSNTSNIDEFLLELKKYLLILNMLKSSIKNNIKS